MLGSREYTHQGRCLLAADSQKSLTQSPTSVNLARFRSRVSTGWASGPVDGVGVALIAHCFPNPTPALRPHTNDGCRPSHRVLVLPVPSQSLRLNLQCEDRPCRRQLSTLTTSASAPVGGIVVYRSVDSQDGMVGYQPLGVRVRMTAVSGSGAPVCSAPPFPS